MTCLPFNRDALDYYDEEIDFNGVMLRRYYDLFFEDGSRIFGEDEHATERVHNIDIYYVCTTKDEKMCKLIKTFFKYAWWKVKVIENIGLGETEYYLETCLSSYYGELFDFHDDECFSRRIEHFLNTYKLTI